MWQKILSRTSVRTVAAAALLFGLSTFSQNSKAAVSKCASIDDPNRLLECYNELSKVRSENRTHKTSTKAGAYVHVKSDRRPGWQLYAAGLTAEGWERLNLRVHSSNMWIRADEHDDLKNLKDMRPSIWLRCIRGRMSGYIDWGIFLDVERAKIVFRFDQEPFQTALARVSKNHQKIEPLSKAKLLERIKEMFGKRKFIAKVTPVGEQPLAVEFDISNLEQAIRPLRETCNW